MSISLKELKKNRLTPAERFVLEAIEGAKPKTYPSGDVDWCKDGKVLMWKHFTGGYLYVSHIIWSVLFEKFGLSYGETNDLLANLLYDYIDNDKLEIYHL